MKNDPLVRYVEDRFICHIGNQAAYAEYDNGRTPYVVYAVGSKDPITSDFAMKNTFNRLSNLGGKHLHWRNKCKIDRYSFDKDGKDVYVTRARVAVLDDDLKRVVLPNEVKKEGEPPKELDDEE